MRSRARGLLVGAGPAVLVAMLACNSLIGLQQPVQGAPDADMDADDVASRPPPDPELEGSATDTTDTPCTDGLASCAGACVDLASSADNCGVCGHACLGAPCVGGRCTPQTLQTPSPARAIVATANVLYVMTDDQLLVTEMTSSNSVAALFPLTPVLTVDGGALRALTPSPSGLPPGALVAVAPGDALEQVPITYTDSTLLADAGNLVVLASSGQTVFWASDTPDASAPAIMALTPPGPPEVKVPLEPWDEPCSLAANADGVFWTGARGTWVALSGGGPLALISSQAFDRGIAPLGGHRVAVADDDGLTIYSVGPSPALLATPFVGSIDTVVAPASQIFFVSGGALYGLSVGLADVGTPTFLAAASVPDGCDAPVVAFLSPFVVWIDAATGALGYVSADLPAGTSQ